MALWEDSGFEPIFVDHNACKEFTCPVCLSLAVQPQLNPPCGHHYCNSCTEKLLDDEQLCPECREDIIDPVRDLYFERKMKQLKVQCAMSKDGCQWVGQLAEFQSHLDCCPLQPMVCDFSYAGCPAKLSRRDLDRHMQESLAVHVGLLCKQATLKNDEIVALRVEAQALREEVKVVKAASEGAEEKIKRLERQLASTTISAIATPEFVMTNFEEHMMKAFEWYSPAFYSHIGGYKMCLSVAANGLGIGAFSYVSVFVNLMRGENDDHLKWPFRGDITVHLVNHRSQCGYIEYTVNLNEHTPDIYSSRVIGKTYNSGWGFFQFIAHSDLPYNSAQNTEYLWNDCLTFRVTKVELK